jgi:long-chain acyl-CoA synthetase
MKIVRAKIAEHFAEELVFLYSPEAKNAVNLRNLQAVAKWNMPGK